MSWSGVCCVLCRMRHVLEWRVLCVVQSEACLGVACVLCVVQNETESHHDIIYNDVFYRVF
jgi:hypothetical protein